jgi:hypothetical protein
LYAVGRSASGDTRSRHLSTACSRIEQAAIETSSWVRQLPQSGRIGRLVSTAMHTAANGVALFVSVGADPAVGHRVDVGVGELRNRWRPDFNSVVVLH